MNILKADEILKLNSRGIRILDIDAIRPLEHGHYSEEGGDYDVFGSQGVIADIVSVKPDEDTPDYDIWYYLTQKPVIKTIVTWINDGGDSVAYQFTTTRREHISNLDYWNEVGLDYSSVNPSVNVDTSVSGQATVTITDSQGDQSFTIHDGQNGTNGTNGRDGADGRDGTNGTNGIDGVDGEPGFSPEVEISTTSLGTEVTITDNEHGAQTFNVNNGVSPSVTTTAIQGGTQVQIEDATGTHTFSVLNGTDGSNGTSISIKANSQDCRQSGDGYIDGSGHLKILTDTPGVFTDAGQIKGPQGDTGDPGMSALQTANNERIAQHLPTFSTTTEWLASLKGADGQDGASPVVNATKSGGITTLSITDAQGQTTQTSIIDGVDGAAGKSAFELAQDQGYSGTMQEWLASLKGADGADGTSISVKQNANACTQSGDGYIDQDGCLQILDDPNNRTFVNAGQIKGPKGDTGVAGVSPNVRVDNLSNGKHITITDVTGTKSFDLFNGINGTNGAKGDTGNPGADGKSAFQLANEDRISKGLTPFGTVEEFLDDLSAFGTVNAAKLAEQTQEIQQVRSVLNSMSQTLASAQSSAVSSNIRYYMYRPVRGGNGWTWQRTDTIIGEDSQEMLMEMHDLQLQINDINDTIGDRTEKTTDITTELNGKADKSDTYTKSQTEDLVNDAIMKTSGKGFFNMDVHLADQKQGEYFDKDSAVEAIAKEAEKAVVGDSKLFSEEDMYGMIITFFDGERYVNYRYANESIENFDETNNWQLFDVKDDAVTATIDGGTGVPSVDVTVSEDGSTRTTNFAFHNLKGAKGDKGDDGQDGQDGFSPVVTVSKNQQSGDTTITATKVDGSTDIATVKDGFSPIITNTDSGRNHNLSIVTASGTTNVTIQDGEPGANGKSTKANVEETAEGVLLTIKNDGAEPQTVMIHNGADGQNGAQGPQGNPGYSPSVTLTTDPQTADVTIQVTDQHGTTSATLHDGLTYDQVETVEYNHDLDGQRLARDEERIVANAANITALQSTAQQQATAIASEVQARTSADAALNSRLTTAEARIQTNANRVTTVEATQRTQGTAISGLVTGLQEERTAREASDVAHSADITRIDAAVTANATAIATLEDTAEAQATTIANHATAINSNATSISTISGLMTSFQTAISALQSKDNDQDGVLAEHNTAITTNASAIASQGTRIGTNESDIASLKSRMTTVEGKTDTNASNISLLDTSVGTLDTRTTSLESRASALESMVPALVFFELVATV